MAFQSTFTANIQPLEQAIKSAEPALANFEQRSKQVGKALQGMVSEFDGTKLIQQATLLVGAIDKIGGASKLTEAEQRRVNGTVEEALAKYRALGQEAPKALLDLAAQTKKLDTVTSELPKKVGALESTFSRIGTIATGALAGLTFDRAIQSAGAFISKTIETGGALTDMSAKIAVGTSTLQRWKFAAEQNGNTLDQLAGASVQLSKRLVEGSDSTVGALEQLGLRIEDIRRLSPEEAFEATAAAVAKVPDPMRQTALAMELFGRSGAEILPTVKSDMAALGNEAQRLGLVMDEQTVAALDDLGDTLDKASLAGQGLIARAVSPLIPLLNEMADAALSARTEIKELNDEQRRGLPDGGKDFESVNGRIRLKEQASAWDLLKIALFGVHEPTRKQIAAMDQLGLEVINADRATLAMSKTITAQNKQLNDWARATQAATAAADRWLGRDLVARAQELVTTYERVGRVLPVTVERQREVNDALSAAAPLLGTATPAFRELFINTLGAALPVVTEFPKGLLQIGQAAEANLKPISLLTNEIKGLNDAVRTGVPSGLGGRLPDVDVPKPAATLGDRIAGALGQNIGTELGNAIIAAAAGGGSIGDTIGAVLGQAIGKKIGSEIGKSLGKSLGQSAGTAVGQLAGALGGAVIGEAISLALDKLFKTQGKRVNDLRDQIVLTAGGIGALNEKAVAAGVSLDRLLAARNEQDLQIAVIELENAFKRLDERIQKVGTGLAELSANGELLGGALARELLDLADQPAVQEALRSFLKTETQAVVGGLSGFAALPRAFGDALATASRHAEDLRGEEETLVATIADLSGRDILSERQQQQLDRARTSLAGVRGELDATAQRIGTLGAASSLFGGSAQTTNATGLSLVGTFGDLVAQGASPTDAVRQLAPAIGDVQTRLTQLGIEGPSAFKALQAFATLAGDEIAGPVFDAVGGLGRGLVGLHNTGGLTQEIFTGLTGGIYESFHNLELLGKGGIDAARGMQQPLQRTWELVKDFGYTVDEDTQKLLDFAEGSGLIGDKFRPSSDKLVAGFDRVALAIEGLVTLMSTKLVGAAETAAGQVETALNNIDPKDIDLNINVNTNGVGGDLPGFKGGSGGLVNFGRGTLAVLHGREAVLTESQLAALASANSGHVTVQIIEDSLVRAQQTLRATDRVLRMQGH